MFTGIVKATGVIESFEHTADGGRLRIRAPEVTPGLQVSASIAVNGCCLTVVALGDAAFEMDLTAETLRRTGFGEMKLGARVNLEQPMKAGDEFGGHFVQGHVDGVGRVAGMVAEGPAENPTGWWYSVRVPAELARYTAMKGSLAIDGISLTVAGWHDGIVDIAIIPYTWEHTNVCDLRMGDAVNLECDVLAKYLERLLEARNEASPVSRLTFEKLVEQGF